MRIMSLLSKAVFAAALPFILAGCATRPGGIAASSTPLGTREYRQLGRVTSSDTSMCLFGVIPITGQSTIRDALDKGIKSRNGDAMINITVDSSGSFWLILSTHTTRVEGDVIEFTD